jgi:hypothetical protein
MPTVFINGVALNETDPEVLTRLLADKIGVSKCFLKIESFTHLLFYAGDLMPVSSDFTYDNYEKVTYEYRYRHLKYKKVGM